LRRRTLCAGQATMSRVRRRRIIRITLQINKYDGSMGLAAASFGSIDVQLKHYS
jgi:hypothetical protein